MVATSGLILLCSYLDSIHMAAAAAIAMEIACVGAHMRGLPLNHQLISLEATFVRTGNTAPCYRFYSLGPRPLLVRQMKQDDQTASIALEVWSLPIQNVGHFLQLIPSPLGLGSILLDDGSTVKGFIGEAYAAETEGAVEITRFGGWRAFLESKESIP